MKDFQFGLVSRRKALSMLAAAPVLSGLAPAVARAQAIKRGGTLIVALEGEPPTLSPYLNTGSTGLIPSTNYLNFLVTLDPKLNPRPDLARSWDISPDGKTYSFHLAPNVQWHDGKPFSSADVKFTLEKILPTHPRASTWWTPNLDGVDTPDANTVVIRLKSPFAPIMSILGMPGAGPQIFPQHIYDGTDPKTNPANNKPIGTGPFVFKDWVRGDHLEFARNEHYFKKDLPYIDRMVIRFLPDLTSRMLALQNGEVDFVHYYIVPFDQIADIRKWGTVTVDERGGEGAATSEFTLFNLRHPILGKLPVRKALATALNKQEILQKSVAGLGRVQDSALNSHVAWAFNPDVPKYPYDVAAANKMLDDAGYPRQADGTRFSISISWATGRDYEGLTAEVIKDQLRAVGVKVDIRKMDVATFIDRVFLNWDFDMAQQLLTTGPDPTISVTRIYHSKQIKKASFVNAMGYNNPAVDKLLDEEFSQTDQAVRAGMWKQMQALVAEDLPVLPMYELPVENLYTNKMHNAINTAFGQYESHESVWLSN